MYSTYVLLSALLIESMGQIACCAPFDPLPPSLSLTETLFGFKQEDLNANVMLEQRQGHPVQGISIYISSVYIFTHTYAYNSLTYTHEKRERHVCSIKGKAS